MNVTHRSSLLCVGFLLLVSFTYLSLHSALLAAPIAASYTIVNDENNQKTIKVTEAGAVVTLADIQAGLDAANQKYVVNLGNDKWQLHANLLIDAGVTLNLSPQTGVKELQLRSESNALQANGMEPTVIDYGSFVYLKTHNGTLNLDGITVYSWDNAANKVDENYDNGRAYIAAKFAATLNIRNADIGYLGTLDGESYGVSWRDSNDPSTPNVLRTRVTGEMLNSDIHHNYYGVYTYQAENMRFVGNQFHHNVNYGFDPHDYTHDVLVENNAAYSNGAHGFIISRGCNRITFRNNKSYDNFDPDVNDAHGFMLDPGGATANVPQAPSVFNVLEGNEAYGNEGYGMRILGSNDNEIRNNKLYNNQLGISLDSESERNLVSANQIYSNTTYGVFLKETSRKNTILNNQITNNGSSGLQIRSNENIVSNNLIQGNKVAGMTFAAALGFDMPANNQILSNTIRSHVGNGIDLRNAELNLLAGNEISNNNFHAIALSGNARKNRLNQNILRTNGGLGIAVNTNTVVNNTWSQNVIYGNQGGGISFVTGAQQSLAAPILIGATNTVVSGTAPAGATVEIFSDTTGQGQFFEGKTLADSNGVFVFAISGTWQGENLTAVIADSAGNASSFSAPVKPAQISTPTPSPTPPATQTPVPTPRETTTPAKNNYLPLVHR